jgi:type I restriction enzyme M protein
MSNHWRFTSGKKEKEFQNFIQQTQADVYEIEEGAFKESGTNISACIVVTDKKGNIDPPQTNLNKTSKKNTNKSTKKELPPEPDDCLKQFQDSFNSFAYRFGQAEVFIDFLDYVLLVFRWWEPVRDFSYFEKKYSDLYPKFPGMLEQVSIVSDNNGEGFRDALGDLFMELVSHGRNGQFFTPDNICEMMSRMIMPELQDGQTVLDPACGSARMLLAGAKRNRNAYFFGCDNDITCCKMAAINLLFNTMQGEIALMDSLSMDFQKSWEISFRNINGSNMPIYRVIENKEDSFLWKLHMNSFRKEKPVVKENLTTEIPPVCNRKKEIIQLQLF